MILTIDTNRDSPEDIRKAIKALLAILGEGSGVGYSGGSRNIFETQSSGSGSDSAPASDGGTIFGNIFDNSGSGSGAGSGTGNSSVPGSSEESPEVELY